MADTVTSTVLNDGDRNHTVVLTNISDGTGESDVVKVDLSTLSDSHGNIPANLTVKDIDYDVQGFNYVELAFDHTANDTIAALKGAGYLPFEEGFPDPGSAGGTGDIVLTTNGGAAGSSYTIRLHCVKNYA